MSLEDFNIPSRSLRPLRRDAQVRDCRCVRSQEASPSFNRRPRGKRLFVGEKRKAVVADANQKKKGISREKKESKSKVKGKEWMDDAVNGTGRNQWKGFLSFQVSQPPEATGR